MNLKQWAAAQGVSYDTARRWYLAGKLPVPAYRAGRLIVIGEPVRPDVTTGQTVVYARVSSADQRPDLDRQVARVTEWFTGQHIAVDRVVTEVGSALKGHRRKFLAMLRDPKGPDTRRHWLYRYQCQTPIRPARPSLSVPAPPGTPRPPRTQWPWRPTYLTAPPVIPEMIFRWAKMKTTRSGRLDMTTYAKMRFQLFW